MEDVKEFVVVDERVNTLMFGPNRCADVSEAIKIAVARGWIVMVPDRNPEKMDA